MIENMNEPIDPEIVLLGLILVSFFPLNIFPQTSHQCLIILQLKQNIKDRF